MPWKRVLAAAATGLQYALASREFQIPETPGELKKQIEIFKDELFQQENGCKNNDKPFLLRYDQTGRKVCVSEDELLSLRVDPIDCNTKVTLGPKIDGGCSQYNFFNRQGVSLSTFSDYDLKENVAAVPLHRNVPYYHQTDSGRSPLVKTHLYYTSTKFLPCEMHSQHSAEQVKLKDTSSSTAGYCDVDPIVKEKLCWTGVGSDASVAQEKILDGSHFYDPDPCDVIQHVERFQTQFRTPIHVKMNNANIKFENNKKAAQEEAFEQGCTKSGEITLKGLEDKPYYTGDDDLDDSYNNKCGSVDCENYNVDEYTSSGLEKCFRQNITRTWSTSGKIEKRVYTRKPDYTNWEAYFKTTPKKGAMGGNNACTKNMDKKKCVSECYDRCKDMKFPGFSIKDGIIDENSCKCTDYSMETCPPGQKVTEETSRVSYTITPLCEDDDCNEKTRYEHKFRPCQFSIDYRKRKCVEACAAERSLFMTISADGLCLCSVVKRKDNNRMVDFEGGEVCPWSTATRVYKNRKRKGHKRGKGYLGDSFVTTTPIETYQIVYKSYFGKEEDLNDGVLVCEAGQSPTEEIDDWYQKLTGASITSMTMEKLRNLYKKR